MKEGIAILFAFCGLLSWVGVAAQGTHNVRETQLQECIQSLSPNATFIYRNDTIRYDESRIGASSAHFTEGYPILIVAVQQVLDVQAAVKCCSSFSIPISVMNGGHSFEGLSTTMSDSRQQTIDDPDGLLLHMEKFSEVESVDFDSNATAPTITIQAGMRLGRFYGNVVKYSYNGEWIIGGGSCPTVGVVGHTICGGYGDFGRYVGLLSDQLDSLDIVDASGNLIHASSLSDGGDSDLFWALRGCCSSAFGIVVRATFRFTRMPLGSDGRFTKIRTGIAGRENVLLVAMWWQKYATSIAPIEMTCYFTINTKQIKGDTQVKADFGCLYLGKAESALSATLIDLVDGLEKVLSSSEVENLYKEQNVLQTVPGFGDDATIDDLLNTESLPPLIQREYDCGEKGSSLLAYHELPISSMNVLLDLLENGHIDVAFLKPHGGKADLETVEGPVWDDRSPLRRGHVFEIHYCKPKNYPLSNFLDILNILNLHFVDENHTNFSIDDLMAGSTSYLDSGILSSGGKSIPIAYFGQQNALRLAQLREERDPNHVFSSRGASLLIGDITTVLCQNDKSFRFKRRRRKKCSWVKKKPGRRCKKKYLGNFISKYCPETCGMC